MAASAEKHKHGNEMVGLLLFAVGLCSFCSAWSPTARPTPASASPARAPRCRTTSGSSARTCPTRCCSSSACPPTSSRSSSSAMPSSSRFGGEAVHPHLKKIGGLVLFIADVGLLGPSERDDPPLRGGRPLGRHARRRASPIFCWQVSPPPAPTSSRSPPSCSRSCCSRRSRRSRPWPGCARRCTQLFEQLDLLITVYRGAGKRRARPGSGPIVPKEPPKIVDPPKACGAVTKEPKPEKQTKPKPVQATFEFMEPKEGKDGKGSYQLPSPDLLDPAAAVSRRRSRRRTCSPSPSCSRASSRTSTSRAASRRSTPARWSPCSSSSRRRA